MNMDTSRENKTKKNTNKLFNERDYFTKQGSAVNPNHVNDVVAAKKQQKNNQSNKE